MKEKTQNVYNFKIKKTIFKQKRYIIYAFSLSQKNIYQGNVSGLQYF